MEWHRELREQVSDDDFKERIWRYKVFEYLRLVDEDSDCPRTIFCDKAFQNLNDLDKRTNSSIYIGPGRDGTSADKIRVDLKFDPKQTAVSVPRTWTENGIVKTTYCLVVNRSASYELGRRWTWLEEQVPLESSFQIDARHHHLERLGSKETKK